jgi:hypothetical protein
VARTSTSENAGECAAPSLVSGTDAVRAEAKGFNPLQGQDITVDVGQDGRINLTPETGTQSQEVLVTGTQPIVTTTSGIRRFQLSLKLIFLMLPRRPSESGRLIR